MTIWTQRISVSWTQNIGFYERRYQVLRELEGKGLLRRFHERPAQITVRLQDPQQVITFAPTGMLVGLLKPDADVEVARAAAEAVCEAMEPSLRGYPMFGFQWLEPCARSYDEARALAAAAFLGTDHPGHITDFALAIDGKLDDPFDDYTLRAGVVEASEAPGRLAVALSRGIDDPNASPGLWQPETLPSVAVFCEVKLDIMPLGKPPDVAAAIFSAFDSARDVADRLRVSMLRPLEDTEL